jgi:hypothetical protein
MPDEPTDQSAEVPEPASFFDALPSRHREALLAGLSWVLDLAVDAIRDVQAGEPARRTALAAELPQRWRRRYTGAFSWDFMICAVVVGHKLRTRPPAAGYVTACVAEELALDMAVEFAMNTLGPLRGDDRDPGAHFEVLREYAMTDRSYDVLFERGRGKPSEAELAAYGVDRSDLRYGSLFKPFHDAEPVHPLVDPRHDWWRLAPEPPDEDDAGPG